MFERAVFVTVAMIWLKYWRPVAPALMTPGDALSAVKCPGNVLSNELIISLFQNIISS